MGKPEVSGSQLAKSDGMRRPVSDGMRYARRYRRAQSTDKRGPAMKRGSTVAAKQSPIFPTEADSRTRPGGSIELVLRFGRASWFPPFAKNAKDGAPTVLVVPSKIRSLGHPSRKSGHPQILLLKCRSTAQTHTDAALAGSRPPLSRACSPRRSAVTPR